MPRLELRLLGPPEVLVDGRAARLTNRKALALLAFLAAHGAPHPREKLAALLWPDSEPDVARAGLRNALLHLRTALGDGADRVRAERDLLALRLAEGDALDLHDLRAGRVDAWRGGFLDGLEFGDTGFDAWLAGQRDAAHELADRAFDAATAEGDPALRADLALRWLALDRLNERAWRRLIRARLDAGRLSLAREAFEACAGVLREELAVEPAPETLALAERLRDAPPEPPARPASRVPALGTLLLEGRLVGRDAEFARLVDAFRGAAEGRPGAALVDGEPGIGKTRLASAFLDWARHQGARVLRGRAFEAATAPFAALTDALRRALRREPDPASVVGRTWLAELARLLPELRDRLPDLPVPPDDAGARLRLMDAVAELGLALSAAAPLVVLIDDLQWADGSTLDALRYAAARFAEEEAPVLLLLTARAEGLAPGSALAAWATDLGRETPLVRLALGGLSRAETRRLLGGLGEGANPADLADLADLADRLFDLTGGQPLYLGETLRSLLEGGVIAPGEGRWRADDAHLAGATSGVRAVIEARLTRLPPAALALAQAAAILGEDASHDELRLTADLGEDEGLAGLDALRRAGLLRETGAGRHLLSHDRVRETLAANLGFERGRVLHRRAAAALETAHAARPDEVAARIARHHEAAGDAERAAAFYGRAGVRALRSAAPRDAERWLRRALELTPGASERQRDRITLRQQLGAALLLIDTGSSDTWTSFWRAAVDGARAAGLPSEQVDALVQLSSLLLVRPDRDDKDEAARLAREALRVAEAQGTPHDEATARGWLGVVAQFRLDLAGAREEYGRALTLARSEGHGSLTTELLGHLGMLAQQEGRWEEARAFLTEGVDLVRRAGPRASESWHVFGRIARLELAVGDHGAVDRWMDELEALLVRTRDENVENLVRSLRGWNAQLRGDHGEAVRHLGAALAFARRRGGGLHATNILAELAVSTARLGDAEAARAMLEEVRVACEREANEEFLSATLAALGETAMVLGEREGTEWAFRRALRGRWADRAYRAIVGLAEFKAWTGDREDAAELLGALLAWPGVVHFVRVRAEAALAGLRAAPGPPELEEALERGRLLTLEDVLARWSWPDDPA